MYFSQHVCSCLTVSSGLSWSRWVTARMTPARHDQLAMCAGSSGSSPLTHRNRFPTTMAKNPRKLKHSHPTDRTFTPSNCVLNKKKERTVICFAFLRVDRDPGDLNFSQPPPANGRSRAPWNWTLDRITANVKLVSLRHTTHNKSMQNRSREISTSARLIHSQWETSCFHTIRQCEEISA